MVARAKEIREWLRKLKPNDMVSVYLNRNGKSYLRAYDAETGYSKDYLELEMN